MEIVVEVLFVDVDEVQFPLYGILWRFPDDIAETHRVVFNLWCTQQTVLKQISHCSSRVCLLAHQYIVSVARHNAVTACDTDIALGRHKA